MLITGETGSGKEVAARLLHQISSRAAEPFIAVNCAAIPAELLESEIFGHEKGAFTGAQQRHLGYAERAGRGTLFLDEIGDMPTPLQAKLLRLIEDGQPHARRRRDAGSVPRSHRRRDAPRSRNARRLDRVSRGSLFPAERSSRWKSRRCGSARKTSPGCSIAFFENAVSRSDTRIRGISALAEEAALAHAWPGNVRELRNRVDRAVALSTSEWIMPGDLFPEQRVQGRRRQASSPLAEVRDAAERRQIERALEETGGQIAKAAGLLGISRTTLWEKMTRLRHRAESDAFGIPNLRRCSMSGFPNA